MNTWIKVSAVLAALVSISACNKSEQASTTAAASASAAAPASAAPAATAVASNDLPTTEDFEQQAQDEINPQNMDQELDKLEKEISQ